MRQSVASDVGPTFVGDEWSDEELMDYLDAQLIKQLGNNYAQYKTDDPPRVVLEKLELRGFKVVAMAGVGQTCIWTLHKPLNDGDKNLDSPDIFETHQRNCSGDVEQIRRHSDLIPVSLSARGD